LGAKNREQERRIFNKICVWDMDDIKTEREKYAYKAKTKKERE